MSIVSDKQVALYFLNEFEKCLVKRINELRDELGKIQPNLLNHVSYNLLDRLHREVSGIYPVVEKHFD